MLSTRAATGRRSVGAQQLVGPASACRSGPRLACSRRLAAAVGLRRRSGALGSARRRLHSLLLRAVPAGHDDRGRRDVAGDAPLRRPVDPCCAENLCRAADPTALRRPGLGSVFTFDRGPIALTPGTIGGRIALRADEDPRPAAGAPPQAASLSLPASPSLPTRLPLRQLPRPVALRRLGCRHLALTGGFEMGSSVGFSSAGRPCSMPVNARPFTTYEPLLKSGSARTKLGLILADNPGRFQGAHAGKAAAGCRIAFPLGNDFPLSCGIRMKSVLMAGLTCASRVPPSLANSRP